MKAAKLHAGEPNCASPQGETSGAQVAGNSQVFQLSKDRWTVLFGLSVFGFHMGLVRDTSSILSVMVELLGLKLNEYVYLSQLFFSLAPIASLPAARLLDRVGLRAFLYLCVCLVALQNGFRIPLFWPETANYTQWRLFYWIASNVFQAILFVAYWSAPLKVAENWFPKEERSLAWSMMSVTPLLGSAAAGILYPRFVPDIEHVHPLAYLNLAGMLLCLLVVLSCVTRSLPKHPPSNRRLVASGADDQSMYENMRKLFRDKNLVIQLFVWCIFDSMNDLILSILQDILSTSGLSQVFIGQFIATTYILTSAAMTIGGFLVSRAIGNSESKDPGPDQYKTLQAFQCIAFLLYTTALSLRESPEHQWLFALIAAVSWTMMRGLASPLFANLAAQLIAGHVTEASWCAAQNIVYCIFCNINSLIFVYLRTEDSNGRPDYALSMLFAGCTAMVITFIYLIFFQIDETPAGERVQQVTEKPRSETHGPAPGVL